MTVARALQLLSLIAAAGLLLLTIASVIGPSTTAQAWHLPTIVLAWVVVIASTLAARDYHRAGERPIQQPADPVTVQRITADTQVPLSNKRSTSIASDVELLRFAQELHGTLDSARLHQLIGRRLTEFVRGRDVWVVARFDGRQHLILPQGNSGTSAIPLTDQIRQWMTFPMHVDGLGIGVLGVCLQGGPLSDHERRTLTVLAGLVAQSLQTVNAFEAMREASLVDPLTGCATRAEGLRRFEAELRRAERARTSLAVLMLDLDHFKTVNDRFGHGTGDAVLSAIGDMLLKTLRASDVRCRWGGEEFLLVMTESNPERARRACEALRLRIANTPVRAGGRSVQITVSIGVTLTRPGELDVQKLLARADAALYRAKNLGRNRVELSASDLDGDYSAAAADDPVPRPVPIHGSAVWTDRRDPARPDRRRVPSPGRRRTDPGYVAER